MKATRADVSEAQVCILRKLELQCEIPLHDVIAVRMRIKIGLPKRFVRCGHYGKRAAGERSLGQARGTTKRKEWGGEELRGFKEVRKREHIENPEAGIDGAFAIFERVQGKAYTRLKIAKSWIVKQRIAKMRSRVCQISQDG